MPDKTSDPQTYKVVADLMMHGPCGNARPNAPCMQENVCSKKFPKKYNDVTFFDDNGHVHYRRRRTSTYVLRGEVKLDNTYVVPYNRLLCLMFHAHINVEYCGWSMLIKYLFKYISKGTDRIAARVIKPIGDPGPSSSVPKIQIDEIQNFIDGRFLCPNEACWRILDFPIHHREPAVQILAVHLKDMQRISFRDKEPLSRIATDDGRKLTTLTEWFTYNKLFEDGRHLTYLDFPSEYVWYEDSKTWRRRKIKSKYSIGRLVYVHPAAGELFYFRMLLAHQKGCTSFVDVRTVNSQVFSTYREACQAMGLLDDDKEWDIALQEAAMSATASELRTLFAHILIYCEVAEPLQLWERHWHRMADDIPKKASQTSGVRNLHVNSPEIKDYIIYEIEMILNNCSKSVKDFGFSLPPQHLLDDLQNRLLMEERNYNRDKLKEEADRSVVKLNIEQQEVYNIIINACRKKEQEMVFVYGHGGTGKTFLWQTIINTLRSEGKIVLAVASSGIASLLLPSGRTAHSRFKIPLELSDETMCNIKKNTLLAKLLIETDLIIWDEAPMNDRRCFEALDRSLRDILNNSDKPFGGKPIMLGGDFRQTLPVKKKATKSQIIDSSIAKSKLWRHFKVYKLKQNMRVLRSNLTDDERQRITDFSSWLLHVGDGDLGEPDEQDPDESRWITIPAEYQIPNNDNGIQQLIDFIYDKETLKHPTAHVLQEKAIVCPKNDTADTINEKVLSQVEGQPTIYMSSDEAIPVGRDGAATEMLYPPEYLNTFKFPGLPPNKLQLKVGVPIMLLRNVNLGGGLCNGTRMIVTNLMSKLIEAEVITGTRIGEKVYIPRIPLTHRDPNYPFIFKRKQFPVKVCYAMTINKSQGQSLNKIGIYLPQPVFSHGQLYVALSRATSPHGLKILLAPESEHPSNATKNIVYRHFLNNIFHTTGQYYLSEMHDNSSFTIMQADLHCLTAILRALDYAF